MSRDRRDQQESQPRGSQMQMGPQNHQPRTQQKSIYDRIVGQTSLEEAVIFGLLAAIAVYGISSALVAADSELGAEDENEAQLEDDPGWLESRGWVFFADHFVDTQVEVTANSGQQVSQTLDLFDQEETTFPSLLYRLIPVAILTLFGYVYASRNIGPHATIKDGARSGGLIMAGYLPAVIAGVLIFTHQSEFQGGSVAYEVPLMSAVPIAGIVYPLIFGALGGYLLIRIGWGNQSAAQH